MPKRPKQFEALSDDAITVLKGFFQRIANPGGQVVFEGNKAIPHPRTQAALDELVEFGIISEKKAGGVSFYGAMPHINYQSLERVAFPKTERFPVTIERKDNSERYKQFKAELDNVIGKSKKPSKALGTVLNLLAGMSLDDIMKVQKATTSLIRIA